VIEQITAGVDWISATLGKDEIDYHVWRADAHHVLGEIAKEGYVYTPRRLLGYEGHSAGNCFVGENEYGSYAQFSGDKADRAFDYLVHPKAHYSRLDLQVTIKSDVMNVTEGKRCYRAAMRANAALPIGRRRKLWIICGSDGGDTVYVGAASSEQRARIYNKEVQSEDIEYTRCWRYEVVYRNDLSTAIARNIASSNASRTDYCFQEVIAWLHKRGVSIPDVVRSDRSPQGLERTKPTDVETKLKWLREQVAPTVRYLTDNGMRDLVVEALGMSEKPDTDS
jgi:hypothetical protein